MTGATVLRSEIPRSAEAGRVARRLLGDGLRLHVPPLALADAQLVASEMVNHAFLYGLGEIELSVVLSEDSICLEVSDGGSNPHAQPHAEDSLGSGLFGLQIIDQIAEDSGVREMGEPPGRSFWAKLSRLG
ncbi:MAG TPA: ATP-binding protein [Actinospica sp.]|nr:ATP-binding protein [Actinospica sp.]